MGTGAEKQCKLTRWESDFLKVPVSKKLLFNVSALCRAQSLSIQGAGTTSLTIRAAHPFRRIEQWTANLAFHFTRYSNQSNLKKKKFTKECNLRLSAGRSRWWIRALQCCCSSWSPERDSIFTKPGWEIPPFSTFWHPCWPKQGPFAGPWGAFGTGCWSNTLIARCSTSFFGRTGHTASDGFSWKGHHWAYWALARLPYFLKEALDMVG